MQSFIFVVFSLGLRSGCWNAEVVTIQEVSNRRQLWSLYSGWLEWLQPPTEATKRSLLSYFFLNSAGLGTGRTRPTCLVTSHPLIYYFWSKNPKHAQGAWNPLRSVGRALSSILGILKLMPGLSEEVDPL